MKELTFNEYYDKVLGCYVGKNIGGTLGAPFECFRGLYDIGWFMQDVSKPIPNDDLDLQLVWLRAVEMEKFIDSHVLAEYWNTYISASLAEYGTGKNNFNMGAVPPLSGELRNVNRHSNGAWIRAEIWATLCAGNPALAANYAYYDSSVDHGEEGIYSAVFCAALMSAAFFEGDIPRLIEIGLSYIPEDCAVARAVRYTLAQHQSGADWKRVRIELFKQFPTGFGMMAGYWKGTTEVPACKECPVQQPDPEIPHGEMGYDAPWHMGALVLSLLWGGGDFARTVCLAVDCGEDTDCTAGTAGAILGIVLGDKGLPERWKNGCSDQISTWTLRIDQNLRLPRTVQELAWRIVRLAPGMLGYTCDAFPGFMPDSVPQAEDQRFFTVRPVSDFFYAPENFHESVQEDAGELIAEHGRVVRRHFSLYTVLVDYGKDSVAIEEGKPRTLKFTFRNKLFDPQFLQVRLLDVPEDWEIAGGNTFCVGLEHWHGSINYNTYTLRFTPGKFQRASYTFVVEISSQGRMTRNYIPVTFLNGACQ